MIQCNTMHKNVTQPLTNYVTKQNKRTKNNTLIQIICKKSRLKLMLNSISVVLRAQR